MCHQPSKKSKLDDVGTGNAAERSLGRFNVVKPSKDGYGSLPTELSGTEDIGTRLGERTVTLRLARLEERRLVPWCSGDDDSQQGLGFVRNPGTGEISR